MRKTICTCDRCGNEVNEDMAFVSVGINWMSNSVERYGQSNEKLRATGATVGGEWCRTCIAQVFDAYKLQAETPAPNAPPAPTTIEELVRQIVREELRQ